MFFMPLLLALKCSFINVGMIGAFSSDVALFRLSQHFIDND
jgi:hypothetical protein